MWSSWWSLPGITKSIYVTYYMFITFFFEHGIGKPQSLRDRKHSSLALLSENQWTLYVLPRKRMAGTWKSSRWKGKSSSKSGFLGSMLLFSGVHNAQESPSHLQLHVFFWVLSLRDSNFFNKTRSLDLFQTAARMQIYIKCCCTKRMVTTHGSQPTATGQKQWHRTPLDNSIYWGSNITSNMEPRIDQESRHKIQSLKLIFACSYIFVGKLQFHSGFYHAYISQLGLAGFLNLPICLDGWNLKHQETNWQVQMVCTICCRNTFAWTSALEDLSTKPRMKVILQVWSFTFAVTKESGISFQWLTFHTICWKTLTQVWRQQMVHQYVQLASHLVFCKCACACLGFLFHNSLIHLDCSYIQSISTKQNGCNLWSVKISAWHLQKSKWSLSHIANGWLLEILLKHWGGSEWLLLCNSRYKNPKVSTQNPTSSSWWFQPIWKILVKLDHFPR